jgi:hypothetical protein
MKEIGGFYIRASILYSSIYFSEFYKILILVF